MEGAGRSIRIEKSWLNCKIERSHASPLQNLYLRGVAPPEFANSIIDFQAGLKGKAIAFWMWRECDRCFTA
jgi:hypothetical protein